MPSVEPGLVSSSSSESMVGLPNRSQVAQDGYDFRQSKIENLRLPMLSHENVRRLDVPVNDALRVCGIQRVGDLDAERSTVSISKGLPLIRCLSVEPSSSSMAMKDSPCSSIS